MSRQAPSQFRQRVAQCQDREQGRQILHSTGRADLNSEPPQRLLVGAGPGNGFPHALHRPLVQRANQLLGFVPIVVEQGPIDVLAQGFCLGRDEVASSTTRSVRATRVRYGRCACDRHARRLGGGADRTAQFLQNEIVGGALLAAQQAALEFLDEHRARFRLERPEVLPQPLDGLPIARHEMNRRLGTVSLTF